LARELEVVVGSVDRQVPADRFPVRSRAFGQIVLGVFALVGGLAVLTRTGVSLDTGWTGHVPRPLQSIIGAGSLLLGCYLTGSALVWMFWPARGPRPPVVQFEADCVAIRGSLLPRTFVIDRGSVTEVRLRVINERFGHLLGLGPMVIVRTADGRGRGVQHLYEGDPSSLASDVAAWASVPMGS